MLPGEDTVTLPPLPDQRFEHHPEYEEYVTSKHTRREPIHNWFVYPHSFAPQLVHRLLDEYPPPKDALIYDPFVGAGTTLLACRERGVSAVGTDLLPLSVFVSNIKVRDYHISTLKRHLSQLHFGDEPRSQNHFASVPIVEKAFNTQVIKQISIIYEPIQEIRNAKYRGFFLLGLLSILGDVSNGAKWGGWLKLLPDKKVNPSAVIPLFEERIGKMIQQLEEHPGYERNGASWTATIGDARSAQLPSKVDFVISSPPYLNKHDYTRVFALELTLAFVKNADELKALRYQSLRSHVEARSPEGEPADYSRPRLLQEAIKALHDKELYSNRLIPMIEGYFKDMYSTLVNLRKHLNPSGKIALVLGNARYAGVMIPVDQIVGELGEQAGLVLEKIIVARYRGNSAQQMDRFGKQPSRESIIIWRNATT